MRTSREYVTSSGSEGEDGAVGAAAPVAAAPAAPAGALESSRPAWHRFTRQRMQLWAKWDQVAAAVFLGVVVAARFRVGNLPSEAQETHGLALIFLSSAVMMWGHELAESGWGSVRAVLVLALKFGAATCPLFSLFSQEMFNVYPDAVGLRAVVNALMRTAVADHTGLLLLLGTILPQYIVADAIAQCLFLFSLSNQTATLCNTPVWVGVLLPLLLSMRRESAAAARFAQENGVPPTDCRRRAYTWLHRATTVGTPASGALAAGLIGVYAVCAAAAWAYLGRVYG